MNSTPEIYIAEDDDDDALIFQEVFKICYPDSRITVYPNGEQLLKAVFDSQTPPAYIFLDINMPLLNGLETLVYLKANRQTAHIPTFMFSGTDCPKNIRQSYQLGASSYFTKPEKYSEIITMAETFKAYWNYVIKL